MNLVRGVISTVLSVVGECRLDRVLRPLLAGPGVILTFHRVSPPQTGRFDPNGFLNVTPEFLGAAIDLVRRSGFEIIGMDDVLSRLRQPAGRRFAILTFDDGFRDTLDVAATVLRRKSAPWTVYAVPSFLEGTGRLWWLEIEECLRRVDKVQLDTGGRTVLLSAKTVKEKTAAYAALASHFYAEPSETRFEMVDDLCRQAEVNGREILFEYCATWTELIAAAREPGVTVGAHTMTHPVLSRCSYEESVEEITGSKTQIEARLGRPVRHLAYPHGTSWAFGRREMEIARAAGFETAVSTSMTHLSKSGAIDPFALPRISMDGGRQTAASVRGILSGITAIGTPLQSRRRGQPEQDYAAAAETSLNQTSLK